MLAHGNFPRIRTQYVFSMFIGLHTRVSLYDAQYNRHEHYRCERARLQMEFEKQCKLWQLLSIPMTLCVDPLLRAKGSFPLYLPR